MKINKVELRRNLNPDRWTLMLPVDTRVINVETEHYRNYLVYIAPDSRIVEERTFVYTFSKGSIDLKEDEEIQYIGRFNMPGCTEIVYIFSIISKNSLYKQN